VVEYLLLEHFKSGSVHFIREAPVDNALKQQVITTIVALFGVVEVVLLVVVAEERLAPDEEVGADAEGVDFGCHAVLAGARLHIRPEHGEHARLLVAVRNALLVLGAAEVGEQQIAIEQQEVVRLQVAVQDAFPVHLLQRGAQLEDPLKSHDCGHHLPRQDAVDVVGAFKSLVLALGFGMTHHNHLLTAFWDSWRWVFLDYALVVRLEVAFGEGDQDEEIALVSVGKPVHGDHVRVLANEEARPLVLAEPIQLVIEIVSDSSLRNLDVRQLGVQVAHFELRAQFDAATFNFEGVALPAGAQLSLSFDVFLADSGAVAHAFGDGVQVWLSPEVLGIRR